MKSLFPISSMKKEYAFVYSIYVVNVAVIFMMFPMKSWLPLHLVILVLLAMKLIALQRLASIFLIPKGYMCNPTKLNGHYINVRSGETLCQSKNPIHYRFRFCMDCLAAAEQKNSLD